MAASQGALQHGDRAAREVSQRIAGNFASASALQALTPKFRQDGMIATIGTSVWQFNAASTATASSYVLVPTDAPTAGRWLSLVAAAMPVQAGTITLVAGTVTLAAGITITASSRVICSRTAQGGTSTAVIGYDVTSKTVGAPGTGAFTVVAANVAGGTVTTDTSTLDYVIVG